MITYSFPCQDLSLQGSQRGLHDGKASSMLWEVERILLELKKLNRLPKYLVMENVKSLFSAKYIDGFKDWTDSLEKMGYKNTSFTLNSKYHNLPQNRDRAFLVSKLGDEPFAKIEDKVEDITDLSIKDYIDDIPTLREFFNNFSDDMVDDWSPKRNSKTGFARTKVNRYTFQSENLLFSDKSIAPTITASGALNRVKIIYKNKKIRILNSKELWKLMGFDGQDWVKVNKLNIVPQTYLKKQAGNSIAVTVLEKIFREIGVDIKNGK